ncbi:MAG: rod shape-determining protein MreC [Alphaproteobacteria bacterium]|nr:rod shape-determining protein MreC [Alphaproteobacteria bacterium]
MKQTTLSVYNPVVSVIKEPVYWVRNGIEKIQDWIQTYQENEHLKEENEELLKWRSLAIQLKEEQKELKKYLNFTAPEKTKHLVAEVAMDEGSAFTRSFIVAAGANQGVTKGMLAFSPKGLFARVVEVMPNFSRIMTLTDYKSRVPVWIGENKVSALLIGDNTSRPFLQFLNENETVQKGEVVMTSGYVGVYPPGLLIGYVNEIQEDEVRVQPIENGEKLSFVRLIDFPLSKPLLEETE